MGECLILRREQFEELRHLTGYELANVLDAAMEYATQGTVRPIYNKTACAAFEKLREGINKDIMRGSYEKL